MLPVQLQHNYSVMERQIWSCYRCSCWRICQSHSCTMCWKEKKKICS